MSIDSSVEGLESYCLNSMTVEPSAFAGKLLIAHAHMLREKMVSVFPYIYIYIYTQILQHVGFQDQIVNSNVCDVIFNRV